MSRFASVFVAAALVAACASDSPAEIVEDDGGTVEQPDSGPAPVAHDSGGGSKADTSAKDAGKCVAQCTSDSECQNSCPVVTSGINCCDTTTGTCYPASTSTCPVPQPDSGQPPPY